MPIRLLYLTREPHPSFRPDISVLFGEELPRHGIQTDIVTLGNATESRRWPGGLAFTRAAGVGLGKQIARLRSGLDLFRLSGAGGYAALQVRDRIAGALVALCIARWRKLPFFYWMSLPFPEAWIDIGRGEVPSGLPRWKRYYWYLRGQLASFVLYRWILPHADHVFVQSDAMQRMLAGRLPVTRMSPVPMGAIFPDNPMICGPSPDRRLDGRRVVVYLGALERIRHPEVMLEAMALVIREFPDAVLALVGDSQNSGERAWLESEITRLGLQEHAFITGWLKPSRAKEYLCHAEVGLSPFPRTRVLEVASPTKVCEYLAYRIPVVANDQADQAYLIQKTGGGYCVPLSPEGFADGIRRLLLDPGKAREMAERGCQLLKGERSYEVLGQELAACYRLLLGVQKA